MKSKLESETRERKPTRKQIRAMALVENLARDLHVGYKDELRYYFLAGMTCQEIADELEIVDSDHQEHVKTAKAAVSSAIRGSDGYFGVGYKSIVNKRERSRTNRETQKEKLRRNKSFKLKNCFDITKLTEDETPRIPERLEPERRVEQSLLAEKLEEVMQTLSYREREVLKFRYGLFDYGEYTYDEISKMFAITRERESDKSNFVQLQSYLFYQDLFFWKNF
ncbi:hypothetical protein HY450_02815 [Candidatus Pacearchaeota archaeon]|nr:hypothetical protein [Candidatus Pacearchaeota archaeon]